MILAGLVVVGIVLQVLILLRGSQRSDDTALVIEDALLQLQQDLQRHQQDTGERIERELRSQVQASAQSTPGAGRNFAQLQQTLATQMSSVAGLQNQQIDGFARQLVKLNETNAQQLDSMRQSITLQAQVNREEQAVSLKRFGDTLNQQLSALTESMPSAWPKCAPRWKPDQGPAERQRAKAGRDAQDRGREAARHAGAAPGRILQAGLGPAGQGAPGPGRDAAAGHRRGRLKRVLTNVKTRGTWGEVQLEILLEQMLTPDQYAKNVETVAAAASAWNSPSACRARRKTRAGVDADRRQVPQGTVRTPARCAERADADGVASPASELERAVRGEAKTIAEKYLSPPHTTDFAILFLPTEGLYAEVMRRPACRTICSACRVTIAGPSTLSALLNSLQMGFRTLALEKRSSEVWQVLGAVKTEFGKFGDVLTKAALERAARNIDQAETRTRQMTASSSRWRRCRRKVRRSCWGRQSWTWARTEASDWRPSSAGEARGGWKTQRRLAVLFSSAPEKPSHQPVEQHHRDLFAGSHITAFMFQFDDAVGVRHRAQDAEPCMPVSRTSSDHRRRAPGCRAGIRCGRPSCGWPWRSSPAGAAAAWLGTGQAQQGIAHEEGKTHHHRHRIARQAEQVGLAPARADAAKGQRPAGAHGDLPERHFAQAGHDLLGVVGRTNRDATGGDDRVGLFAGTAKAASRRQDRPAPRPCPAPRNPGA
jgi:DNA recombination protein RmuC